MLSLTGRHRYFLYREATDMRKQFDGLSGLVNEHIDHPLLSGDVFIFLNRRRDRIKLLMWDHTGFALYYKRLERGTFELPANEDLHTMELSATQLNLLLAGIELASVKYRKRYQKRA